MKRLSDLKKESKIIDYKAKDGGITVTQEKDGMETKTEIKKEDIENFLRNLEKVQLHLKLKINLEDEHCPRSCCILPNGLVAICTGPFYCFQDTDLQFTLSIYNLDGSLKSTKVFREMGIVQGMIPIDEDSVAVSSNRQTGTIYIINVDRNQIVNKLNPGGTVGGLCCEEGFIMCCVTGKGLVRVSIDSGEVETVVTDESVGDESRVHMSSSHICYTCPLKDTVTILDSHYKVISIYHDETVLKMPIGVTIDQRRNIYVTGCGSDNLVVISLDGGYCYQVLCKSDGLDAPTAVHYDSSTKTVVVANFLQVAYKYLVG